MRTLVVAGLATLVVCAVAVLPLPAQVWGPPGVGYGPWAGPRPIAPYPPYLPPLFYPPLLNRPILNRPILNRPILNRPILNRPILNRPILNRPLLNRPLFARPFYWTPWQYPGTPMVPCPCPTGPCTNPCVQPSVQPAPTTSYIPQPVVQYRDVQDIEYRQQAVTETVPVTRYQQVTVDEGGYQMVWVPRLVTRQVPRTEYETRLSYRTVAVPVTRRVAEVRMQLVPAGAAGTAMPYAVSPNGNGYTGSTGSGPVLPAPSTSSFPPPLTGYGYNPVILSAPVATAPVSTYPLPSLAAGSGYSPDPVRLGTIDTRDPGAADWSHRSARSADAAPRRHDGTSGASRDERLGDWEIVPPRSSRQAGTPSSVKKPSRAAGKFVPAPSAARVWKAMDGS